MYDPTIGRWTTQDPIEFMAGDPDLYRYVDNSPTNATDPTGLQGTNDELFREAGRKNGCPREIIELILQTATQTIVPAPTFWQGLLHKTHNYCESWAEAFTRNLAQALNARGYKDGLKYASKGAIKGPLEKTVWLVPRSCPLIDPDQDHTAMKLTFNNGSVFYIDCGTISTSNINNLTGGASHIGLPSQVPPSWRLYPIVPRWQPIKDFHDIMRSGNHGAIR